MSKNFYMEEYSGDFNDFDYFLNAELETGVTVVSVFLNHERVHFGHILKDFKCMLGSLKEHYRNTKYDGVESQAEPDSKEFEVKMDPDEYEVTVTLYNADFDSESLIESFAYSIGYIQSFMLHRFSKTVSE